MFDVKYKYSSTNQILSLLDHQDPGWSHIELGAANYGSDPFADKTHTSKGVISEDQFAILFYTVDKLIKEKGEQGTLYINDLEKSSVDYTIQKLEIYLKKTYPDNAILIEALVGNFLAISLPKVDSIHLKNPEFYFFNSLSHSINKKRLATFADSAKEGLTLVTHFKANLFPYPLSEHGIGYLNLPNPYPNYKHIDGKEFKKGKLLLIKSLATLRKENMFIEYTTNYPYFSGYKYSANEMLHYIASAGNGVIVQDNFHTIRKSRDIKLIEPNITNYLNSLVIKLKDWTPDDLIQNALIFLRALTLAKCIYYTDEFAKVVDIFNEKIKQYPDYTLFIKMLISITKTINNLDILSATLPDDNIDMLLQSFENIEKPEKVNLLKSTSP